MGVHGYLKRYLLLVGHGVFDRSGSVLFDFFIGAVILASGGGTHGVALFYALEFGLRGTFSLFAPNIIAQWGTGLSVSGSYIIKFFFFAVLVFLPFENPLVLCVAALLHSLSAGIYYPAMHSWRAASLDKLHVGRFHAVEGALSSLVLAGVTWGAGSLLSTGRLWLVVAGCIICSVVALWLLNQFLSMLGLPRVAYVSSSEVRSLVARYVVKREFRRMRLLTMGQGALIVTNIVFIPLFIFYEAGKEFSTTGLVLSISLILSYTVSYLVGYVSDSYNTRVAGLIGCGCLFITILALSVCLVFGFKLDIFMLTVFICVWRISYTSVTGPLHAMYYEQINLHTHPAGLSSVKEATLCWTEGVILGVAVIVALTLSRDMVLLYGLVTAFAGAGLCMSGFRTTHVY